MDKKIYLDQIVLKAKIGGREDLQKLKDMYSFLLDQIYESLCEIYPFIRGRRAGLFGDFYFFFWDAINTYDFTGKVSFSYHLKESLIKDTRKAICEIYGYEEPLVVGSDEIKRGIRKKEVEKDVEKGRRFLLKSLKVLTIKQKKMVYLHCYRDIFIYKCRYFGRTNSINVKTILQSAYKRLRGILKEIEISTIDGKYKEKIYEITEVKISSRIKKNIKERTYWFTKKVKTETVQS